MGPESRYLILYDEHTAAAGSDCDCACAAPLPPPPERLDPRQELRCHPLQQVAPLEGGFCVVAVPSLSRVAVVNRATLELLERFRAPRALAGLGDDELAAVERCCALGLLHGPAGPAAPRDPAELSAWLHVTNACNLRCTYCYVDKSDEPMAAATAYAVIDAVLRSARSHGYGRVQLKYAGGEASLNLALVEQMHAYAQAQAGAIAVGGVVLSNGVGLTRRKLERIRARGLRLMISLDGPQAYHDAQRPRRGGQGSFHAVAAAVGRARALGLDLTVSVTVSGGSAAGLAELVDWLLEREVHFKLNFYRECDPSARFAELRLDEERIVAGMRAAYAAIERRLPRYSLLGCLLDRTNLGAAHRRTCAAGESYLVIDQRGGVAKCQMELAHTPTDVWAEDPLQALRNDPAGVQNLPVEAKEGCRDCGWKYWCAGGCAVATYRATGRYDVQSPNCGIYQTLYPELIRLEGLRLLRCLT